MASFFTVNPPRPIATTTEPDVLPTIISVTFASLLSSTLSVGSQSRQSLPLKPLNPILCSFDLDSDTISVTTRKTSGEDVCINITISLQHQICYHQISTFLLLLSSSCFSYLILPRKSSPLFTKTSLCSSNNVSHFHTTF